MFPYSLSSALFVLRSLDFSSGAECNRRAVSSFNISAFEEVLKALIRVLAKLSIEWPKERWEAPHSKLDECFLTSGQAQPPKRNCWCYRLRRLTCWRSWVPARASCMAKTGIKDKEKSFSAGQPNVIIWPFWWHSQHHCRGLRKTVFLVPLLRGYIPHPPAPAIYSLFVHPLSA